MRSNNGHIVTIARTLIVILLIFMVAAYVYHLLLDPSSVASAVEWHTRRVLFDRRDRRMCEELHVTGRGGSDRSGGQRVSLQGVRGNRAFLEHPHYSSSRRVVDRYNAVVDATPRGERKYLQCSVGGGLGNHILDYLHCAFIALLTNRTIVLTRTRFSSLLDMGMPFVHVHEVESGGTVGGLTTLWDERAFTCANMNCWLGSERNTFAFLMPGGSCYLMVGHLLSYNPHHADWMAATFGRMPYGLLSNHVFRPSATLTQQIDTMFRKSGKRVQIGFHIRAGRDRADHYRSIPVADFAKAAIECARPWTQSQDSLGIYLATDSDVVREVFIQEFGKDAMTGLHGSTPPDNGKDDMLMTDMWACIRADHFVGTFFSSITSHIALQRMDAGKVLLRDGSCQSYLAGKEPIWPDSKPVVDKMYPSLWDVVPKDTCGILSSSSKESLQTQEHILSRLAKDYGFPVA